MGRRRIKLTIHGEGTPALRLAINVNPERYVTTRELLDVLSSEIHRHMGKSVTIPQGTKIFWKSTRGYTTPATSFMLVHDVTGNREANEGDLPIGLGLRHVGINVASRTRRAQDLSGIVQSVSTDVDKKGSDYFTDFILLKDASLIGDGDELLIDEWSDVLRQTLDKQAEDARFSRLRGGTRDDIDTDDIATEHAARKPGRSYPFNLEALLDRDDAGVTDAVDDPDRSQGHHASHLVLLQKVLRELMMYHIKTTVFLSAQCSKEASIAAQDLTMAQFQNERVAEALLDEVTLEGTITDPSAVLRALTQLAVQRGKEEREHSDGLEAEKMRQLASVYRARIARLEAALNVSDEQVDQLQKKAVAIDIGFKEDLQRARATISRLESENGSLRARVATLDRSTGALQEGMRSVAAVNERLFRETKSTGDINPASEAISLTARPKTPPRRIILGGAPQKTNITKLASLAAHPGHTSQERGVLGALQEANKSTNNAAQAVAQRMEEDHFTTVLSSTRDNSTLLSKVNKASGQSLVSHRKELASQEASFVPPSGTDGSWQRWKTTDETHRSASNVQNTSKGNILLPDSSVQQEGHPSNNAPLDPVTVQLHIVTEQGEKRVDTMELNRGDAGDDILPLDAPSLLLKCTDSNAASTLERHLVPVNGHQINLSKSTLKGSKRKDRRDPAKGVADPTSNFMAFYQQIMNRIRRWQSQARHVPVSDTANGSRPPSGRGETNVESKIAPAITAALFATEDEESLAIFPHTAPPTQFGGAHPASDNMDWTVTQPADEDHCGYLVFFRIYYIRNGRRITITNDDDLQLFLDVRQGNHFTCNVVEVSNSRHMFASALIRRGLARECADDIEGRRSQMDALSQTAIKAPEAELDRLLQLGGHVTMGPAFSLADDPCTLSTSPAAASNALSKKQQFFTTKRNVQSQGADVNAGPLANSTQDAKPDETAANEAQGGMIATADPAMKNTNIFLNASLEDVPGEATMKKIFESLTIDYNAGVVPGLPISQLEKFAAVKQPPTVDDGADRPVQKVSVAHVVRYLSSKYDDMGNPSRFWRVVEQVILSHGTSDGGDPAEPTTETGGDNALGSKNIDEAIAAAINQAKGSNKRANPRNNDTAAKAAEDVTQVPTAATRSHHTKQAVLFNTPVTFSSFALICLRLAKE